MLCSVCGAGLLLLMIGCKGKTSGDGDTAQTPKAVEAEAVAEVFVMPDGQGQLSEPAEWFTAGKDEFGHRIEYNGQAAQDGKIILTASNGFFDHGIKASGESDLKDTANGHKKGSKGKSHAPLIASDYAYLDGWDKSGESMRWHLYVAKTGSVKFSINLKSNIKNPDGEIVVSFAGQEKRIKSNDAKARKDGLVFQVANPGKHTLQLKAETADGQPLGELHTVDVYGPAVDGAKLLRARWRPAAVHGGYRSSKMEDTTMWVMVSKSLGSTTSYSPITTPFGYYGGSFGADQRFQGGFNFSMWSAENAPLEQQAHLLALDARWSVRGDWLPDKLNWDGILRGMVDRSGVSTHLDKLSIPTVALTADETSLYVVPDYSACGLLAAEELLRYGVKHLLIPQLSPRALDLDFFQGAVALAYHHQLPHTEFRYTNKEFRLMIKQLVKIIESSPKPLGLCLPHAAVGHSITNALNQSNIRVPEDLAIVVVDKDVQQTAALAPISLTSIELNEWHRGFVAAETLHRSVLEKNPSPQSVQIPPHGVHGRASTGHTETRDPIMAKALGYLRNHYQEEIGVPEIVLAAGASRRVVEMRFREVLNRSIHEELRRLRIEDAQRHLKDGKLTITDIAHRCGFSSVHYFSAAFKREIGISPRQFQQQN